MPLFDGVRVLTKEQMHDIHLTVLRVLREVGLEIHLSSESFARLRERGLRVDESARRVWLEDEAVLETIRQLSEARSPEVTVEGVDKDALLHILPARLDFIVGAHHGFVLDERDQMRPVGREDMLDSLRVQRCLPGVSVNRSGLLTQEVPEAVAWVHTTAFNVKYCEDPWATDCNGPQDARWITRIMRAAGVWDEDTEHGGSIYARSPLCLTGRGAEFLELAARAGRPRRVTGMPASAATAPGTMVGYLVQYLTESFGFTTIGRLIAEPPNDVISPCVQGDDITAMDVRRGIYFIAGPDISLMRMSAKQIFGEFYKIPGSSCCSIRTFTDAKKPGIQAATEKTFQALCDLMVGVYSDTPEPVVEMSCTGSLNCNLALSLEQAVIDHELFQSLERLLAGVRVDEDTLGFEAIKRVGPSGLFLSDEHTVKHARSEWWFPGLYHRGSWDAWVDEGRPDVRRRAREVVHEAQKAEIACVLPDDVAGEVNRLVREAELDLLGTTTGTVP